MRTKLHYITLSALFLGAVSRVIVWPVSPTIPTGERLGVCLIAYSVLLASYAILAAVAWFTRRSQSFPFVLCIGSAANVAFGVYRDYHHFLYSERSWYGGLDVLDAIGQLIAVLGGLLLVAFLYGLSSMLQKRV